MLYIAFSLFYVVRASIAAAAPRRQLILSSNLYHVSKIDHSTQVLYGNVDYDGFGNKLDSLHTELERCRDVAIALAAPRERSHLQREHAMRHAYHGGSHGPSTAPRAAATAAADAAAADAAAPAPRATSAGVAAGRRAPKLLKAVSNGAVAAEPLFVPNVAGRNESVYREFPVTNAGNNTLLPSPWLDARQLRRSRRVVSPFEVFEVASAGAGGAGGGGGGFHGGGSQGYGNGDDGVTKASGSVAPSVPLLRFLSVVGDTPAAAPGSAEAAAVAAAHSDWRRLLLSKCTPQAALIVTNNVSKAEDSVRSLLARRADGASGDGGRSNGLNNVTGLCTSKAHIVLFEPPEDPRFRWSATRLMNYTLELSRFIQYHLLEMERDAGADVDRDGVIRQCVVVLVYGGERGYVPWNEVNAPWWKINPLLRQRAAALLNSQYENEERILKSHGGVGGGGGYRNGGALVEKAEYGRETGASSVLDVTFGHKKDVALETNAFFATTHFLGVRNYEYQLVFSTAGQERLRDTLRLADDHLLICAEDLAWWRWVHVKVVARSVKLHLHSNNFTNPTGSKQAIYLATSPRFNIGCAVLRLAAEMSTFAVVYFSEGAALAGHGCTDEQLRTVLQRNGEIGSRYNSGAALWRARNAALQMHLSLINSLILDYTVGSSAQGAFFGTYNVSTLYQQMRSNRPIIGLNDVIPVEFGTYFRRERYAPMAYNQFAAATAAYRAERAVMTDDERRMHEVDMLLLRREAYGLTRRTWKEAFGDFPFSHI